MNAACRLRAGSVCARDTNRPIVNCVLLRGSLDLPHESVQPMAFDEIESICFIITKLFIDRISFQFRCEEKNTSKSKTVLPSISFVSRAHTAPIVCLYCIKPIGRNAEKKQSKTKQQKVGENIIVPNQRCEWEQSKSERIFICISRHCHSESSFIDE